MGSCSPAITGFKWAISCNGVHTFCPVTQQDEEMPQQRRTRGGMQGQIEAQPGDGNCRDLLRRSDHMGGGNMDRNMYIYIYVSYIYMYHIYIYAYVSYIYIFIEYVYIYVHYDYYVYRLCIL
jgi:hypothetical protein